MIAHKNAKKWTPREMHRFLRMKAEVGCIACWLEDSLRFPMEEAHHILRGNKRMGHWYTLPVCKAHHADCHNGAFNHDRQIHFWVVTQHALNLDDSLPASKIVPRKVA